LIKSTPLSTLGFLVPLFIFGNNKLKLVKQALKEWERTSYSPPLAKKEKIRMQLEEIHTKMEYEDITVHC